MTQVACPLCKGSMEKINDRMPEDNIEFEAYKCASCGEELMNMDQLGTLAEKYRALRKAKGITFQMWGNSIGMRIPKSIADSRGVKPGKTALIIEEKSGFRVIVS